MPVYRISAEVSNGRKTVAYRRSTGDFVPDITKAQRNTLTPKDASDWLKFTWYHFRRAWPANAANPIWNGHRLDQVRLVLEEMTPGGNAVVEVSVDWDSMPTVTSSTTTSSPSNP